MAASGYLAQNSQAFFGSSMETGTPATTIPTVPMPQVSPALLFLQNLPLPQGLPKDLPRQTLPPPEQYSCQVFGPLNKFWLTPSGGLTKITIVILTSCQAAKTISMPKTA